MYQSGTAEFGSKSCHTMLWYNTKSTTIQMSRKKECAVESQKEGHRDRAEGDNY